MPAPQPRTVTLPADQTATIDTLIATGAYPTEADVIRAGLEALQDRAATIEQWLHDEVGPAYDAMQADPSAGIPMEEVFAELRADHARRMAEQPREL